MMKHGLGQDDYHDNDDDDDDGDDDDDDKGLQDCAERPGDDVRSCIPKNSQVILSR
jgi:hypothetical protein